MTDAGDLGLLLGLLRLGRGAAGGNIPQAVGGAAQAGSGLANLAGESELAGGLGGIGGPLSLISSLISGNLPGAALSLPGAVAGGTALAGAGATALGTALPAGLAAAGSLAATIAPYAAMLLPAIYDTHGGDFFDQLLGDQKSQGQKQNEEFQDYAAQFPQLAADRAKGASLFGTLGQQRTPEQLQQDLQTAGTGRNANVAPAAWNLEHRPTVSKNAPMDLGQWDAISPDLGGMNWGAMLNLLDQGNKQGMDAGNMTGKWSLTPQTAGEDPNYRTSLGNPENSWDKPQTREAQDLGNAVSGIGQALGIDWHSKGAGDYQNFDAAQLPGYGFDPGNYGPAALNYLRSFDPNVTSNPKWADYQQALDPGQLLATLAPLALTPRATSFNTPEAPTPDGGGF